MHKALEIFNTFYQNLLILKTDGTVKDVMQTNIDPEQDYPLISVNLGQDVRDEWTKQESKHSLTIFTDISVKSTRASLDAEMLAIREQIEILVIESDRLELDYIFKIDLVSQSQPSYNQPASNWGSTTRLEWLIEYITPRNNPSV